MLVLRSLATFALSLAVDVQVAPAELITKPSPMIDQSAWGIVVVAKVVKVARPAHFCDSIEVLAKPEMFVAGQSDLRQLQFHAGGCPIPDSTMLQVNKGDTIVEYATNESCLRTEICQSGRTMVLQYEDARRWDSRLR